jgi:hypothetical protein
MTLNDTLAVLTAREEALIEERVPAGLLRMEPGVLRAGDRSYGLRADGLVRLCKRLGAPPAYLAEMDEPIQSIVLQHHLDRGDLGADSVSVISRGNEFISFARPDLLRLSSTTAFTAVRDGIGHDLDVHDLRYDDESFQVDLLILQRKEFDVLVPGHPGLRVVLHQ